MLNYPSKEVNMTKYVYLDSAATTFTAAEVLSEMMPCFNTIYGNASSLHSYGRDAMLLVDKARDRVKNFENSLIGLIYKKY